MRGVKKDLTPWVIPNTSPPRTTKYCYSGDPETLTGWTEFSGSVWNCGGSLVGNYFPVNTPGNRTFVISSGAENLTISPNEKQTIVVAQLIARGTSNVNSVTKLKQFSEYVRNFYFSTIGINELNSSVPVDFILYQNYPNPFNPVTTIKFSLPNPSEGGANAPLAFGEGLGVRLIIYDILGREISVLVNEKFKPGTYEVEWDASNYPSGLYFYKLQAGEYSQTKRMVLIK